MLALVTGAAGFIGSHLVEGALAEGWDVRGVDAFTPYYDVSEKRANLEEAGNDDRFQLVEADLRTDPIEPLLDDVDVVFHLAAQPGVRSSWATGFTTYLGHNVAATQRLLEACRGRAIDRLVFASSSSVYGQAADYPTRETQIPAPHSPYGVTKLAAEHLCHLYAEQGGVPTVSLRYFTVYGPRQRPDMAMRRFIEGGLRHTPVPVFGDGTQVRDLTYVGDVVRATLAAATVGLPPVPTMNVAGGSSITLLALIDLLSDLLGAPIEVDRLASQPGDVRATSASTDLATKYLDWEPRTSLADGLRAQVDWQQQLLSALDRA